MESANSDAHPDNVKSSLLQNLLVKTVYLLKYRYCMLAELSLTFIYFCHKITSHLPRIRVFLEGFMVLFTDGEPGQVVHLFGGVSAVRNLLFLKTIKNHENEQDYWLEITCYFSCYLYRTVLNLLIGCNEFNKYISYGQISRN